MRRHLGFLLLVILAVYAVAGCQRPPKDVSCVTRFNVCWR